MKYNLLLLKRNNLKELDKILYSGYKNIVSNLVLIGNDQYYSVDIVYKKYMGFEYEKISRMDKNFAILLESILPTFSYLGHSQGGRGIFIEKLISVINRSACRDVRLKELPLWFAENDFFRLSKIFDKSDLTKEAKQEINERKREWRWNGDKDHNIIFDLGSFQKGQNSYLTFCDLKNRVDSGGTAARRESWSKILKYLKLLDGSKIIFKNIISEKQFSLREFLDNKNISKIMLSFGVIFNMKGMPAVLLDDKEGFLSESKKQFENIKNFFKEHRNFKITYCNDQQLCLKANFEAKRKTEIIVKALYGNEIIKEFVGDSTWQNIGNKIPPYDDIWLTLKVVLDERRLLIERKTNLMKFIETIFDKNPLLKTEFFELRSKLDLQQNFNKFTEKILEKTKNIFGKSIDKNYVYNVLLVILMKD
ncbi:hypothetical protein AMJ49_05850 [Parcubacteria bacterium DG_74_2]|nr:MAG: hypothetical protein AMJ49_05850 [Parcubacteria bacterium DG_74_2]